MFRVNEPYLELARQSLSGIESDKRNRSERLPVTRMGIHLDVSVTQSFTIRSRVERNTFTNLLQTVSTILTNNVDEGTQITSVVQTQKGKRFPSAAILITYKLKHVYIQYFIRIRMFLWRCSPDLTKQNERGFLCIVSHLLTV